MSDDLRYTFIAPVPEEALPALVKSFLGDDVDESEAQNYAERFRVHLYAGDETDSALVEAFLSRWDSGWEFDSDDFEELVQALLSADSELDDKEIEDWAEELRELFSEHEGATLMVKVI